MDEWIHIHVDIYIYTHTVYTVIFYAAPLENPEEEPFEKECSFSNHQFSWDMFVCSTFPYASVG